MDAGENKFSTQIGVNGLLNMRKLHEASLLIEDLSQIQHHCREALHSDLWRAIGTERPGSPEHRDAEQQPQQPVAAMQPLMKPDNGAY